MFNLQFHDNRDRHKHLMNMLRNGIDEACLDLTTMLVIPNSLHEEKIFYQIYAIYWIEMFRSVQTRGF